LQDFKAVCLITTKSTHFHCPTLQFRMANIRLWSPDCLTVPRTIPWGLQDTNGLRRCGLNGPYIIDVISHVQEGAAPVVTAAESTLCSDCKMSWFHLLILYTFMYASVVKILQVTW